MRRGSGSSTGLVIFTAGRLRLLPSEIEMAVSQQITKTTPAITSVIQCTPSSTLENAVAATASPATSQLSIRTARWLVSVATHTAKTVKARHDAAA